MLRGAESPGHLRSHVPPVQLTEHAPVQVTWQVASLQLTLLLGPTVSVQVVPAVQDALQDWPHVPLHVAPLAHCSEQLSLSWPQPTDCDQP